GGALERSIQCDVRGTGLSDPVPLDQLPDLETQVQDVVAVLDAAGARDAAVGGVNDGTIIAMMLAAGRPELCRSLVLFASGARHVFAAGMPMERIDDVIEQ